MLVDLIVIGLVVLFAANGYRQGLITSVASFVGFFGGAVLGSQLARPLTSALASSLTQAVLGQLFTALLVVFGAAFLGQFLTVWLAQRLRRRLTWRPARYADAVLGALVSAGAVLLVVWMVASPLAGSSFPTVARQVRESAIVGAVDSAVPSPVRSLYESLRELIDRRGLPDVLDPFTPTIVTDVPAPDPALVDDPVVVAASPAVVKITGIAPSCSREIDGSGFLYAEDRVLTNAHVLAGVREPKVHSGNKTFAATTVFLDEEIDIAVLLVPGLKVTPLAFADTPQATGADAIILGYPGGGPLYVGSARIRDRGDITGPDFRGAATVTREVYSLRGTVRAGNSGGPLLDPRGAVLGVVFASAVDDPSTGYALTNAQISEAAAAGLEATGQVGTGACE